MLYVKIAAMPMLIPLHIDVEFVSIGTARCAVRAAQRRNRPTQKRSNSNTQRFTNAQILAPQIGNVLQKPHCGREATKEISQPQRGWSAGYLGHVLKGHWKGEPLPTSFQDAPLFCRHSRHFIPKNISLTPWL
jgi:hypothetical protein